MNRVLVFLLIAAGWVCPPGAVRGAETVTEADWVTQLARFTGLQSRLYSPGTIQNYIEIISQPGYLRFEAEKADFSTGVKKEVTLRYGVPSGDAYLQAGAGGGLITFRFVLPARRTYLLQVRSLGGEQEWMIDESRVRVPSSEGELEWREVGDFELSPGPHDITVTVPPEGALDAFELITDAVPSLAPRSGFQPEQALRYGKKAESVIRALDLLDQLPVAPGFFLLRECERFQKAAGSWTVQSGDEHGSYSGTGWVAAGAGGAALEYEVDLPGPGLYGFEARVFGGLRQIVGFDYGRDKSYFPALSTDDFSWTPVGAFFMEGDRHHVQFELPPGAGMDGFRIIRHAAAPEDYLDLLFRLGFQERGVGREDETLANIGDFPGITVEAEQLLEKSPAYREGDEGAPGKKTNGIRMTASGPAAEWGGRAVKIEDDDIYTLYLLGRGAAPIGCMVKGPDGTILDQRPVYPPRADAYDWTRAVDLPLREGEVEIWLSFPPGSGVDAVKLVPRAWPEKTLAELVEDEVDRDDADGNLERMRAMQPWFESYGPGPDVTLEPQVEEQEDEEYEYGPASPALPGG